MIMAIFHIELYTESKVLEVKAETLDDAIELAKDMTCRRCQVPDLAQCYETAEQGA
jgi:hypothetical protein